MEKLFWNIDGNSGFAGTTNDEQHDREVIGFYVGDSLYTVEKETEDEIAFSFHPIDPIYGTSLVEQKIMAICKQLNKTGEYEPITSETLHFVESSIYNPLTNEPTYCLIVAKGLHELECHTYLFDCIESMRQFEQEYKEFGQPQTVFTASDMAAAFGLQRQNVKASVIKHRHLQTAKGTPIWTYDEYVMEKTKRN